MSTRVVGIDGKTYAELDAELAQGGRFIFYQYAISLLIITFRRSSNIIYIPPGHNAVVKGLPYVFISLFLGWWGIPWGPIYTVGSIFSNLGGGKDVTNIVANDLFAHARGGIAPPVDHGEIDTRYTPPQS